MAKEFTKNPTGQGRSGLASLLCHPDQVAYIATLQEDREFFPLVAIAKNIADRASRCVVRIFCETSVEDVRH
jgi:hypothetical protein